MVQDRGEHKKRINQDHEQVRTAQSKTAKNQLCDHQQRRDSQKRIVDNWEPADDSFGVIHKVIGKQVST